MCQWVSVNVWQVFTVFVLILSDVLLSLPQDMVREQCWQVNWSRKCILLNPCLDVCVEVSCLAKVMFATFWVKIQKILKLIRESAGLFWRLPLWLFSLDHSELGLYALFDFTEASAENRLQYIFLRVSLLIECDAGAAVYRLEDLAILLQLEFNFTDSLHLEDTDRANFFVGMCSIPLRPRLSGLHKLVFL